MNIFVHHQAATEYASTGKWWRNTIECMRVNTSYLSVASLLGAISKGMQAVILCTNRILQILNWRCQLTD